MTFSISRTALAFLLEKDGDFQLMTSRDEFVARKPAREVEELVRGAPTWLDEKGEEFWDVTADFRPADLVPGMVRIPDGWDGMLATLASSIN